MWQSLLALAHRDKARAYTDYSRYYLSTDGQIYWYRYHRQLFAEEIKVLGNS